MNLFCCCQIMAPNTRITRKWEIFAGRNKFYCDGLLMSAPHTGVFYLTCFLITGTSALFFAYDCPDLATRITPFIPIIGAVLYFFTMSSLLRTTFTDPGIIPRASHDEAAYIEKQIEVPNSLNSPTYRPPPRTKEVLVKGQVVKLKYCFTCKIFRPPRASHCSLCDNCVDRFDHHCPWVGNCVGKRNYRFFYMFLVSLAFLAVFIFSCSITHLVLLMKEKKEVWEVIKSAPCSVVVTIICFFSIWSVIGLAGFHTYLTTSDQTTNEDLKGSFSSKGGQRAVNPYSRGNICLNCVHILCGPMTPSLIDRRGVVTDDFMLQMHPIYSPAHPVTEIPTIQTPTMITQQPVISGADVLKPLPRLFDETLSASGMYRHRSYDNLQNGNSNSLAHLVDNEIPLSTLENTAQSSNTRTNSLPRHPTNPNNSNLYRGASVGQQTLSPVISVPTSNNSAIMLIDDDNMDTSIAILPNKNNLSGSYNNLFRDNLENSCSDYLLEKIVISGGKNNLDDSGRLSNKENSGGIPKNLPNLTQSTTLQDIVLAGKNSNINKVQQLPHSTTLHEINFNKIGASATLNEIQQIDSTTQSIPLIIDSHNNIPLSASTRRLIQLQNIQKLENENVYSNIPSGNATSITTTTTSSSVHSTNSNLISLSNNDLNKSDPNLHLYSNLIEEHQAEQQRQASKQKRHSEPSPHQQQQLVSKFEKNKVTSTTKPTQSCESKNLIVNTIIQEINPNKLPPTSTNTIKATISTTKKQRKINANRAIDDVETINQIKQSEPVTTKNAMSSSLLCDDLDLDDPVSAFVANTRNRKLQNSQKSKKKKTSSDIDSKTIEHDHMTATVSSSSGDNQVVNINGKDSNRLKHLHDTTMIDTALDLDSLDGTSIGLVKSSAIV
ncbi:palmitoyltransferase app [Condylostylus longicornis]|uniref:palmitoyltransferase app n=1 Tax=Condylostylus longicornis TaxID=2530218 RepID=UPI00244E3FE7|nr:palmitoyltransferase app [Condylostylus longicornis]